MTHDERAKLTQVLFKAAAEMGNKKNKSYADKTDTLANFKRIAEKMGLTKYQIWAVYFNKHIDSINNAIKDHPELPVDASESLEGRLIDVIVYSTILYCLLYEDLEDVLKETYDKERHTTRAS